jgi:hypothetical protein
VSDLVGFLLLGGEVAELGVGTKADRFLSIAHNIEEVAARITMRIVTGIQRLAAFPPGQ